MKKDNRNKTKKTITKKTEKALFNIAEGFSILPCGGPWYEIKVPKILEK